MDDNALVFISYATPDRDRVLPHYAFLKKNGFRVWMDNKNLIGGQRWDYEIRKALNQAAIIVMFISNNSVNRRGYVQREIKLALDKINEKLMSDIYIIPVLLDTDANKPDQLLEIQFIDANEPDFYEHLLGAVRHQLVESEISSVTRDDESEVSWSKTLIQAEWSGLPGFSFSAELINLSSSRYNELSDCGDVIKGWIKAELMGQRKLVLHQDSDHFNFGYDKILRVNTWDAYFLPPIVKGGLLSIKYEVSWYMAGAVHPNMFYKTFVFLMEPLCEIASLEDIFEEKQVAFDKIKNITVERLLNKVPDNLERQPSGLIEEDIVAGLENWSSLRSFVFLEEGIEILFSPYQVACYAAGPQTVIIPYEYLTEQMSRIYRSALNLRFFRA